MDMQNVSNLTIPEGEVKAIHNSSNQLLWGRVNYDTKYAGDIFQQTYTGKNLFNGGTWRTVTTGGGSPVPGSGAIIVDSGTNSIKFSVPTTYTGVESDLIPITSGQTITLSFNAVNICNRMWISQYDSSKNRVSTLNPDKTVVTTTVTATDNGYIRVAFANTASGTNFEFNSIQLELGQTATSYEPFVGSTSTQITLSPNPYYPQDIQVTTGTHVISITDGANTQNFTVDLGSTELAKISNYQDYIYKSDGDWYVRKEIGKYIFTGDEPWSTPAGEAGAGYTGFYSTVVYLSDMQQNSTNSPAFMSILGQIPRGIGVKKQGFMVTGQSEAIGMPVLILVLEGTTWTVADIQSVIAGADYRYVLKTPTDTKITDSTLISQLNAVHQWLVRYGYNATVTGNLPIVIDRTNL